MKRLWIGLGAAAIIGIGALCYNAGRASANGIPLTNTLYFNGSLLTFGQPDNSTHQMSIALYVTGSTTAACGSTSASSVTCVNGQFTIPVPATCVPIIHADPNLQVQITVDNTPMGMTPLSAVPYAVEADTASNASAGSSLAATQAAVAAIQAQLSGSMISLQTTTLNSTWSATVWTDVTSVVSLTPNFTAVGIGINNSTFTFSQTGTYWIRASFNTWGENQYTGLRMRRLNGTQATLLQRTTYTGANSSIGSVDNESMFVVEGLFQASANDTIDLQYATLDGVVGTWGASNPISAGSSPENMVTGEVDIFQVP